MKTTLTQNLLKAQFRDLSTGNKNDNERELRIFSHNKHVMTIRVVNGFVDAENELTGDAYNLLEILGTGAIINDVPKLDN